MILFGAAAEQSIPKLFVAGVLPGLLIALMMSAFVVVRAMQMNIPRRGTLRSAAISCAPAVSAAPALVHAGLRARGHLFRLFARRRKPAALRASMRCSSAVTSIARMSWKDVLQAAARSAMLTAQILVIVATASLFSWILTVSGVPQALADWLQALKLEAWSFLVVVNIILLIVGCVPRSDLGDSGADAAADAAGRSWSASTRSISAS